MASIEEKVESLITKEIENLEDLISKKIEELGYELYDVQYAKEGKEYYLRIFIDKEDGIDLNDCEKVNNLVNPLLDSADYIKEAYFLEVSSPGVERVLRKDKHLKNAIGKEIEIKLFKPIEKQKEICGNLEKYDENYIYLQTNEKEIQIERKNISLMKLKYNWE